MRDDAPVLKFQVIVLPLTPMVGHGEAAPDGDHASGMLYTNSTDCPVSGMTVCDPFVVPVLKLSMPPAARSSVSKTKWPAASHSYSPAPISSPPVDQRPPSPRWRPAHPGRLAG